jgi:hypothetical protein
MRASGLNRRAALSAFARRSAARPVTSIIVRVYGPAR